MKIFKFIPVAGLALVMFLSASCFDVKEEFFFKKDGSGSARVVVDLSQMMELMKAFSGMEGANEEGGENPMASMDEAFDDTETVDKLSEVSGISNVQSLNDKEKGTIGYSFDFADIAALNRAMNQNSSEGILTSTMGLGSGEEEVAEDQFQKKGKKLTRTHPIDKAMAEKATEEEDENAEMMSMMFAEANYTVKYTFEGGVKSAKGDNVSVSGDKKTVTITTPMLDLFKQKATLSTSFKTK